MTKPLTPEQARAEAALCDPRGCRQDKRVAATLRAYADQAERLKEIEEAVGEWAKAKQAYDEADADPLVSPKDFEAAFAVFDAAEARLRALQEK